MTTGSREDESRPPPSKYKLPSHEAASSLSGCFRNQISLCNPAGLTGNLLPERTCLEPATPPPRPPQRQARRSPERVLGKQHSHALWFPCPRQLSTATRQALPTQNQKPAQRLSEETECLPVHARRGSRMAPASGRRVWVRDSAEELQFPVPELPGLPEANTWPTGSS